MQRPAELRAFAPLEPQHARRDFDYSTVAAGNREQLREHAREINDLKSGVVSASIEIGRRLCAARELLGPRQFSAFLIMEVSFSQSTASNLMQTYRRFGSIEIDVLERFDVSALASLARARIAPAARDEAIELARGGERVSQLRASSLAEKHRDPAVAASTKATTSAGSCQSSAAIAGAETSCRPRDLIDIRSAVRVALRHRPEQLRAAVGCEVVDAVRQVLSEFNLEHLLGRPTTMPAPAATARVLKRGVRDCGAPVI